MPEEIKKCPFCGSAVEDLNPEQIKHPWVNGCPMAHVIEWKSDWNRRTTISLETAQKLRDELDRVTCSCKDCATRNSEALDALARFNAEKGGV